MTDPQAAASLPRIGLALGSGSARGMAHIGVLQALAAQGIRPDIICGTSMGALVAAAWQVDGLDALEDWACALSPREVLHYLSIRLRSGGGFADGGRLIDWLRDTLGDYRIEDSPQPMALVATDLGSGQEVWLRSGSVWDAVRASIALPGILTPVLHEGRWLVDGGLLNPVPVSVCRALGADITIAVNLNNDLIGRHAPAAPTPPPASPEASLLQRLHVSLRVRGSLQLREWLGRQDDHPSLVDVLATSINIMQDRITRSRLAGEPADVLIEPRLADIGLLDFEHTAAAIAEGRAAVERMLPALQHALGRY